MGSDVFVLYHLCTFLLTPPAATAVRTLGGNWPKNVTPLRGQSPTTEARCEKKMPDGQSDTCLNWGEGSKQQELSLCNDLPEGRQVVEWRVRKQSSEDDESPETMRKRKRHRWRERTSQEVGRGELYLHIQAEHTDENPNSQAKP